MTVAATAQPPLPAVPGLEVEHSDVRAGGLSLHVAQAGEGPPLLMLHGWPQHWWMWRKVMPSLARRFRLVVPDLRGLGWSDAPEGPYDKQQLAVDAIALIDKLGLERVRIIGHDWGAVAAILLCEEAPERVERCLALSIPAPWSRAPDPRRLLGLLHMPFVSASDRMAPVVAEQVLRRGSRLTDEEVAVYVDVLRVPERRRASLAYYRTFLLHELPAAVRRPPGRPAVPLKLVGGGSDPVCRFERDVEFVRGVGHFLPEDRPDAVIGHALSFLG